jgi:DNA-binding FrmR family transcriptional regulator
MATEMRSDIVNRLKRIEGQIRGLQRLIEEKRDCTEVVHQLAAVRRALDKVGFIVVSNRMQECIQKRKAGGLEGDSALDEAMKLFLTLA